MSRVTTALVLLAFASPAHAPDLTAGGVQAPATGPAPAGFAAGLSNWPVGMYCDGPASATVQPLAPRELLDRVQVASRCGMRLVIVIPRRFLTTTHKVAGPFSLTNAQEVTDLYAAQLPADTLQKYRTTLLGLNLGDDYTCRRCWGGEEITQAQLAEWAAYARAKLPGLPLGIRRTPDWVGAYPPLAASVDYVWAQYRGGRGDPKAFYDRAAESARRLGLSIVMGMTTHDCYGANTGQCSADEITRYGSAALDQPASCAFLNFRYEDGAWERPEIRAAWEGLFARAKARPAADCRRTDGAAPAARP